MPQGVLVGLLVLLAIGSQAIKDLMIAYAYGTTTAADAFLYAYNFTVNIHNVFYSAVTTALIPVYVSVKQRSGPESAWAITLKMAQQSTVLLCVVGVIGWLLFPAIVGTVGGFSATTRSQSVTILNFMLVALVLGGVASVFLSAINAQGHKAFVSAFPTWAAVPVLLTAAAIYFGKETSSALPLAWATLGGAVLQSVVLYAFLRARGFGWKLHGSLVDPDVFRHARKLFLAVVVSSLLLTLVVQINLYVAADLGPGALATFINGQKLVAVVTAVAGAFISIWLLPHFSYLATTGEKAKIAHQLTRIIGWSSVIGVVCVILVWLGPSSIVRLIFQRGQFNANDTVNVAEVLKFSVLGVPFFLAGQVLNQYLLAHHEHRMLALATLIMSVVCVPLAFILASFLDLPGVAINSVLVYVVTWTCLAIFVFRRLRA